MVKAPETRTPSPEEAAEVEIAPPNREIHPYRVFHNFVVHDPLPPLDTMAMMPRFPAISEALVYPIGHQPAIPSPIQLLLNKAQYTRAEVCAIIADCGRITFTVPCSNCREQKHAVYHCGSRTVQCISCRTHYSV